MPQRNLPDGWQPTVLDRWERIEFEHLLGFGMTAEKAARQLGWSVEQLAKRWQRMKDEAA